MPRGGQRPAGLRVTTIEALRSRDAHVGVVGLGYVGRPLAAALQRHFSVYGFDTDERRIRALRGEGGAPRAVEAAATGGLRELRRDRLTAELMSAVYGTITAAGVYRAASIRTAELAKVLENTQRDLNIALMNELAMICDRLAVDTGEVISTAATKRNFARFEPGLVGGHCIGVDPYYLTYVAEQAGHRPQVILTGRRVNDAMGNYVAERTATLRGAARGSVERANVLVLGFAFKENVADVRNSRVADIVHALRARGAHCSIFDPEADPDEIRDGYGFQVVEEAARNAPYDAVVVAVRHRVFRSMFPLEAITSLLIKERPLLIDVKALYNSAAARAAGLLY